MSTRWFVINAVVVVVLIVVVDVDFFRYRLTVWIRNVQYCYASGSGAAGEVTVIINTRDTIPS